MPVLGQFCLFLEVWLVSFGLQFCILLFYTYLFWRLSWHTYGGQWKTFRNWFSPFTIKAPGGQAPVIGVRTRTFTHWGISLAQFYIFKNCLLGHFHFVVILQVNICKIKTLYLHASSQNLMLIQGCFRLYFWGFAAWELWNQVFSLVLQEVSQFHRNPLTGVQMII